MIEFEHVKKRMGNFALQDISFALPKGYLMGLVGQNGAGKTTLLHLLMGLYCADAGEIRVFGKNPRQEEREVRSKIGWVLAEEVFPDCCSLADNADVYGKYYPDYDREVFSSYCGRFGLDAARMTGKLSKGEKLKFQFAFAMAHKPELLVLDEPTASFDPEFCEQFFKILAEFIADGKHSVVLATHKTRDLDRLADYVLYLNDGKQEFFLERGELEDRYRIVTGEKYKLKLLPKDRVIAVEDGAYAAKAFVKHGRRMVYDAQLCVSVPSIEEIMYYTALGEKQKGRREW